MVAIKTADAMPHVSSIQFTKSAFYSATWDSYTTVARGLFIDNIDNTIVARSYEKFFNHGEKTETGDDALRSSLAFPVKGFARKSEERRVGKECVSTGRSGGSRNHQKTKTQRNRNKQIK